MEDAQQDTADYIVLCILLGTGMAVILVGGFLIWYSGEYKKRVAVKMEERLRLNKERFIKKNAFRK